MATEITLAAAIIVVPKHLSFLKDVLEDCRNQTVPFKEVLLVCSGFNIIERSNVTALKLSFPELEIQLHFVPAAPAGTNRNFAGRRSVSDWIFFLDADDRYPPLRNLVLLNEIRRGMADVLFHLTVPVQGSFVAEKLWPTLDLEPYRIVSDRELFEWTFGHTQRNREAEMLGSESIIQTGPHVGPHHGHIACRRELFENGMSYHEEYFPRNEDSVFLRDVLESDFRIALIPLQLSLYRIGSSAVSWKSKSLAALPRLVSHLVRSKMGKGK